MLGYYNYTVVLTYVGLLSAFAGVMMAGNGQVHGAIICLMITGVCDMFDGPIARTMVRTMDEKKFGIQIDSLCDLVGFGVLPAMIAYQITEKSVLGAVVAAGYVLCALIRLAYFNVCEEKRQEETHEFRTCYQGLPVTAASILLPVDYVVQNQCGIHKSTGVMVLMIAMAAAFLSPVQVEKPHTRGKILLSILGVFGLLVALGGIF